MFVQTLSFLAGFHRRASELRCMASAWLPHGFRTFLGETFQELRRLRGSELQAEAPGVAKHFLAGQTALALRTAYEKVAMRALSKKLQLAPRLCEGHELRPLLVGPQSGLHLAPFQATGEFQGAHSPLRSRMFMMKCFVRQSTE